MKELRGEQRERRRDARIRYAFPRDAPGSERRAHERLPDSPGRSHCQTDTSSLRRSRAIVIHARDRVGFSSRKGIIGTRGYARWWGSARMDGCLPGRSAGLRSERLAPAGRRYGRQPGEGSCHREEREAGRAIPAATIWIVDGHNAIFAHPELERLQTGRREGRGEAPPRSRSSSDSRRAIRIFVHVVYDGNRTRAQPRSLSRSVGLQRLHARPGRGRRPHYLDGRKFGGARGAGRSGKLGPSTLGFHLPAGVVQVEPSSLFARMSEREARPQKRPPGDFADIEELLLSRERAPEEEEEDPPPPMTARRDRSRFEAR